jgi:uncharacterized protein YheU (UPF0270 family)
MGERKRTAGVRRALLNEIPRMEASETLEPRNLLDPDALRNLRRSVVDLRDVEDGGIASDEALEERRQRTIRLHIPNEGEQDVLEGIGRSLPLLVRLVEVPVVREAEDVGRKESGESTGTHAVLPAVSSDAGEE